MRAERLVTLELQDEPRTARHGAREARGQLSFGDQPDWVVPVRVCLTRDDERVLGRARQILIAGVPGVVPVVDLGRLGDDAYVAYRVIDGVSFESAGSEKRLVQLAEILDRAARTLPTHGALTSVDVIVSADHVWIAGWAEAPGGEAIEDRRAFADIAARLLPARADQLATFGDAAGELAPRLVALLAKPVVTTVPTAPRKPVLGFDAALGAALANNDADDSEDPVQSISAGIAVTPRATRAIPQLPEPVAPTRPLRATPVSTKGEPVEVVPPSRGAPWLWIGLAAAALAATVGIAYRFSPKATVATDPIPHAAVAAVPVASRPNITRLPTEVEHVEATKPVVHHPHAKTDAAPGTVSIKTDVTASVQIDGRYVGETPLADLTLAAGAHRIHLEASAGSLRMLPRDDKFNVAPASRLELHFDLR